MKTEPHRSHILIVDDEAVVRDLIADVLESSDYRVTALENGKEAISCFSELGRDIDLVILDNIMPGMSGPEIFPVLRGIKPSVRVILLSGSRPDNGITALLDRGGTAFLRKPFSINELLDMVASLLEE